MDYGDIIINLENLVESIDNEELSLLEIKTQLQELVVEIEDNAGFGERDLRGFDFDDLN